MSLTSERLSPAEMKERQRQMLDKAGAVLPTVAVMEPNWRAMIDSQRAQVETLSTILDTLPALATREELQDWAAQYQEALAKEAKKTSHLLSQAVESLEKQAGSMSAEFGKRLSEEREQMESYRKKLFWISMIPSVVLLALELTRRIWPLI